MARDPIIIIVATHPIICQVSCPLVSTHTNRFGGNGSHTSEFFTIDKSFIEWVLNDKNESMV